MRFDQNITAVFDQGPKIDNNSALVRVMAWYQAIT